MSKLDETISAYIDEAKKLSISNLDEDLLAKVTKGLGPSIYRRDASTVSCSDKEELNRLKKNFLIKKLGLADSPELDDAIKSVCELMGSSNRNKYRGIFYYCLVKHFGKESVYA